MSRLIRTTFLAAAVLMPVACTVTVGSTPAGEVPAELASVPEMSVKGVQGWMPGRRVRFGPYAMDELRRGPADSAVVTQGAAEEWTRRQSFAFSVTDAGSRAAGVDCDNESWTRVRPGLGGAGVEWLTRSQRFRSTLDCRIRLADATQPWRLHLARTGEGGFSGALVGGDSIALHLTGSLPGAAETEGLLVRGVHFAGPDGIATFAQLDAEGRVRIPAALPEGTRRALAAAVLILFQCNGLPLTVRHETCQASW
ncbi:MAG TPA: hypothetical protein VF665_21750 [Longimicrobium sp.]|jgi:hypothetical protein|uniref:hypothetical protein n=1 Tax=Longimicrobium sp. TaxID=2029185 RepID=UPI002EDA2BEB